MNTFNIGVTGVGGGVGQGVIKSLYDSGYNVIGLDGELLGAGLYSVSKSYLIPYAKSPDFIPTLLDICHKEKIALLFPGLDAELEPLSKHRKDFAAIGTTVIVSDQQVITISDDKLQTFEQLTPLGIKVPFTVALDTFDVTQNKIVFPVIIKQQVGGARSKNVFLIKTEKEFDKTVSSIDKKSDYILQEYIEGDEYTCGTVNLDGVCKGVIVMRRILRDGDTYKCFTEHNSVIEETVRKIVTAIKPFGACNVQLRLKDNIPYVFEINARCSGTTAARTLCGFNEPKMIADYILKGIEPIYDIKIQTVLRYWKELVVENEEINQLKGNKFTENKHRLSL
ncbi:MAG: hypothetical protein JWO58_504 [Chitinophagaceae bacterium]|nr:hypothetical protein [Chitinophagaceae bacterium]